MYLLAVAAHTSCGARKGAEKPTSPGISGEELFKQTSMQAGCTDSAWQLWQAEGQAWSFHVHMAQSRGPAVPQRLSDTYADAC